MKIILAEHFGICFGVRDAIAQAEQLATEAPLTILGELVHNPIVRERLQAQGVREASLDETRSTSARVMITAHGASDAKRAAWRAAGFNVADATCPLVHHAHEQLRKLVAAGFSPVVIGKPGHVEVNGLVGDFPEAVVLSSPDGISSLPKCARYGIISQTTQPIDFVQEIVDLVRRTYPDSEVRFVDTVCKPTKDRQSALRKLIDETELIVVVGGRTSNNTQQLVETCRAAGRRAVHIERAEELDPQDFDGVTAVGLTAGTSTMRETVDAVLQRLKEFSSMQLKPNTTKHNQTNMNSQQWLTYYQNNRLNRPEPKWNLPSPLDARLQSVLAHSLSHFQLGETGGGTFLIAHVREQIPDDACYHEALQLFVGEEGEHARLLQRLVHRFGGKTIRKHWTHTLFRMVRRALGFKFEIQLLVIAELVGTAYYRLLKVRTRDSVLEETCALLLQDEAQHVDFHADWFGDFQATLLPLERAIWNTQFQTLFTAAAHVAWIDHRACLIATGANRREFFREARRECIRFLK